MRISTTMTNPINAPHHYLGFANSGMGATRRAVVCRGDPLTQGNFEEATFDKVQAQCQ
jgi:hypothetical protein